jgi:hypothetical protein
MYALHRQIFWSGSLFSKFSWFPNSSTLILNWPATGLPDPQAKSFEKFLAL